VTETAAKREQSPERFRQLLSVLAERCHHGELDDELLDALERVAPTEHLDAMNRLRHTLEEFDFRHALELIDTLNLTEGVV
jgi:hypothetical protein